MKLSSLRIAWFLEGEALVDKYRGGHGIADSWGIRVHVARGGGGLRKQWSLLDRSRLEKSATFIKGAAKTEISLAWPPSY